MEDNWGAGWTLRQGIFYPAKDAGREAALASTRVPEDGSAIDDRQLHPAADRAVVERRVFRFREKIVGADLPRLIEVEDPEIGRRPDDFLSKSKNAPFDDRPVRGRVRLTIVDGRTIFRHSGS